MTEQHFYTFDRLKYLDNILWSCVDELPSLYSILDEDARSWHYYRRQREQGDPIGARRKERRSIRDHARDLRKALENGGYATIARTGKHYTLTVGDGHTVSGNDPHLIASAFVVGLPVLDWRGVEDTVAIRKMPIATIGDKEHWRMKIDDDKRYAGDRYPTSMCHVTLKDYLQRAKAIGASIYWRPGANALVKKNHYF